MKPLAMLLLATLTGTAAALCGDCDGDGEIRILDALAAVRHEVGLDPLTGLGFVRCNLQGVPGGIGPAGADVTALEALQIAQHVVGLAPVGECGHLELGAGTVHGHGRPATLRSLSAGDIDRDGDVDLVSHNGLPEIVAYLSNGDGTAFNVVVSDAGTGFEQFEDAALWDHDLDRVPDLAGSRVEGELAIFRGNGLGEFSYVTGYAASTNGGRVVAADFNGDGVQDVIGNFYSAGSTALISNVAGGWSVVTGVFASTPTTIFSAVDLNRDMVPELIVLHLPVLGTLEFAALGPTGATAVGSVSSNYIALDTDGADLDGDGWTDLIANDRFTTDLHLFWHAGQGLDYSTGTVFSLSQQTARIAAADLDGDGDPEIILTRSCGNDELEIFRNTGGRTFDRIIHPLPPDICQNNMVITDLDGDGDLDIAIQGFVLTVVENLLIP